MIFDEIYILSEHEVFCKLLCDIICENEYSKGCALETINSYSLIPNLNICKPTLLVIDLIRSSADFKESIFKLVKRNTLNIGFMLICDKNMYNKLDVLSNGHLFAVVPDDADLELFTNIFSIVLRGQSYMPIEYTHLKAKECNNTSNHLLSDLIDEHDKASDKITITSREKDILDELLNGYDNKNISYNLKISESTVKMHLGSLSKKLDARNRTQILSNAIKNRLVEIPEN